MVVAPAIAFLASDCLAHGCRPWDKTALAALWLLPIATRGIASAIFIPLGVITMIAVYIAILHRAAMERVSQGKHRLLQRHSSLSLLHKRILYRRLALRQK